MGKYMKQPKLTPEVSAMEISKSKSTSTLGVRTRSKTLALLRLQAQQPNSDFCFLNLDKPNSVGELENQSLGFLQLEKCSRVCSDQVHRLLGVQEQLGENDLEFQTIEREIRESTPCDLIRDVNNISTPGSSTKYLSLTAENQRPRSSILTNIPSTREVDELFAHFEQQQQRFFMEKYNFDIINDTPLPGRYEWVEVNM